MDRRSNSDRRIVSRRQAITAVAGISLAGVGATVLGTQEASAQVTMGEFDADDESATVSGEPSSVDVTATGEYSVSSPNGAPDKVEITLQIAYEGTSDDLETVVKFDSTSGAFTITADLLSHRAITASDVTPANPGESTTTELDVRLIATVVVGGEIQSEAVVEDTASLAVGIEGIEASLGGSAVMKVVE